MANAIALSARGLSKKYHLYDNPAQRLREALHPSRKKYHRDFWALRNVSFDIAKGESIGIIGRNGSGKSTLLQLLCGILQPSEGAVAAHGKIAALLELGAGFNPEFTGRQNIYMNGALLGFSKEEMGDRFQAIADFADIGDFIDQPVKTYSSGMYVRLAFAAAIHVDPDILVVDEALAVGDQLFQRKCFSFLESLRDRMKTLIFVSHSTQTINQLCSRALLIDTGQLILDGPAKYVTTHYERLLFAADNATNVRNEIIELNSISSIMLKSEAEIHPISGSNDIPIQPVYSDRRGCQAEAHKQAEFIQGLSPVSTVEYKNFEVDILDVGLSGTDGRPVNLLVSGEEYIFSYRALFHIDAVDVSFGMQIKTASGLTLGAGATFEIQEPTEFVRHGEIYLINWLFRCSLLPNIYFLNVGISAIINNERVYLNRLIDATAFKVRQNSTSGHYGIVDFNLRPTVRRQAGQ